MLSSSEEEFEPRKENGQAIPLSRSAPVTVWNAEITAMSRLTLQARQFTSFFGIFTKFKTILGVFTVKGDCFKNFLFESPEFSDAF